MKYYELNTLYIKSSQKQVGWLVLIEINNVFPLHKLDL